MKIAASALLCMAAAALAVHGCGSSSPTGGDGGGETDETPPVVGITSPLEGSELPAFLDIAGNATDDGEVDTVFFEVRDLCDDPVWSDFDLAPPYEATWDATAAPDGAYRVCMAAVDTAGNESAWSCVNVSKGDYEGGVTGFFPLAAYRGREITAKGSGFGTVEGEVNVNGQPAQIESWNDTAVAFIIPDLLPEALVWMEVVVGCRWRLPAQIDITPPGVIRITDHHAEDRYPCFNAGGDWIYFSSARSGNWDIWRISLDRTKIEQVTFDERNDFMPAVNPSSGELAWMSDRNHLGHNPDGDYEIFTGFTGQGGGMVTTTIFTEDDDDNNTPVWSPQVYSGYNILYTQFYDPENDGGTTPIVFMHSTAGTDSIAAGMAGCFSPNGRWVVYQDNDYHIRKKEIGTTTPIVLTRGFTDFRPDWGRANDMIVFSRYDDNGYEGIFVMNPDGSGQHAVVSNRIVETEPRWSPDCSMIVFTAHRWSNFDIYVYEVP